VQNQNGKQKQMFPRTSTQNICFRNFL